ncbi:MAG: radical SAM protein, partial [Candidatus Omnitrophica bacterium]|nr:radical SAM protein [Candidatus Omnitrophota bacterium]
MKRKVYFADLTYNTLVVSSDLTPLGCGYVAAYAKSLYGNECDIRIFKYPENLLKAVESEPPDIFAGSCYVWNKSLVLLAA